MTGETGTGKDVCGAISFTTEPAPQGPFMALNCAAPAGTICLESELFGYRRGPLTGGQADKPGLALQADGGDAVFWDEIAEMSPRLQAKLLRFLQGSLHTALARAVRSRPVDVRVVAATNQDLDLALDRREFRMDLYYRLKVFHLALPAPPLRRRLCDIAALAAHFIGVYQPQQPTGVSGLAPETLAPAERLQLARQHP